MSGPDECRAVRRLGRKLYTAWLEPNTRLGKQDSARLSACVHRIEYTFPILADCEEHWKARQVMLQIIDNAIDEHKSTKGETRLCRILAHVMHRLASAAGPKAQPLLLWHRGREEQARLYSGEQDDEIHADDSSDLSDSESDA